MRKLGVRTRLLLAAVAVVALAILALVGSFNYILAGRLSASATASARARAEAEVGALQVRHNRIVRAEAPDAGVVGSQVWIFGARGETLEAPQGNERLLHAAAVLARRNATTIDSESLGARLYAVPVIAAQRRLGTVVAAVSTKPYRETQRTALIGSIILALSLLAAITLAARWILRAAFAPVTAMTASAAAWSERDLDRRFALGPPHDELTELAATLDSLLDRLAASLRHEQRFAAELSHELRTPLARISGEAELALGRERPSGEYRAAFRSVYRDARQMTQTVDALVAAARQESGLARSTSDVRDAVARASESAEPLAGAGRITITVNVPRAPVRIALEGELVDRILQPLLENACHYGRSRVDLTLAGTDTKALITVSDDGPGVTAEEHELIFEPGVRGASAGGRSDGSGLGLALALRIARSAGGNISVQPSDTGGRFVVELPLA
ncbi:MAG: sensor histidine kinase [Gaiellaceae bacterium]